jgi:hypothetical protein
MKASEFITELKKQSKPRNFVAKNAKMGGAGQHKDKKKAEKQGDVKHKKELATTEDTLGELSTDKLAQYKKAAGADAKKADADGDYARGDKRFKGINRATNKQFDNDLKKHSQKDVAEDKKPKYPKIKPPKDYDPDWIKKLSKEKLDAIAGPRYKKDKKEQGVAEDISLQDYVEAGVCPICHGDMVSEDQLAEGKKDACYHKIKASSKVWPSAYASGRLVQCRKAGAANYGKGKKK